MKEKKFQWTVIVMLSVIFLIVVIGFAVKRTKSEYGTSMSFMGKTISKNKTLKENLQKANDDTKKVIALQHGVKA